MKANVTSVGSNPLSEPDEPGFTVDLKLIGSGRIDLFEFPTDNAGAYHNEVSAKLYLDDVLIGELQATLLRCGLIALDGLDVAMALDNLSAEFSNLAVAILDLKRNWYKESFWMKSQAEGMEILCLSRLTIADGFRGHRLGLALLQHVLRYCPHDVAVMKPFPLQHEYSDSGPRPEFSAFQQVSASKGTAKLRKYYGLLGFERYARTQHMYRGASQAHPFVQFSISDEITAELREKVRLRAAQHGALRGA